jgi:hypothetical protein
MNKIQQFFQDRNRSAIINKQFKDGDFSIPGFHLLPPIKLDLDINTNIENVEMFKHLIPSDNQMSLPSCCGFAWGNFLETKMSMQGHKLKGYQIDSRKIWERGRNMYFNGNMSGGLHLSQGFGACKELGLFDPYILLENTTSLSDIYKQLKDGPLVTAVVITADWKNPSHDNGYIKPNGTIIGAHAVLIVGVTIHNHNIYVHLMNSWGSDWGWNGIATLSAEYFSGINVESSEYVLGDINIPAIEKLLVKV